MRRLKKHKSFQYFWTPFTLRCAQLILSILKKYPLVTAEQTKSFRPFFIIGSGRSGTTLLRKILSKHSAIVIPPETYGFVNSIKKFIRYNGLEWKDMVNVVFGEFYSEKSFDYWEVDIFKDLRQLYDCPKVERSLACLIDHIYRTYLKKHKPDAIIWGDKTPHNTLRLKWIKKVFPEAIYIHLLRDGRDVVSSYLKSSLITNLDDACARWSESVAAARKFEKEMGSDRVLTLRYEDLVQDTDVVVPSICQFLNLEVEPDMFENGEVYLGDDSLAHLKNVRRPINAQSIGKWKKDLSQAEQTRVHALIKTQLLQEGYLIDNNTGFRNP